MDGRERFPRSGDDAGLDAWVAAHLSEPETIWQAFRDFPEQPEPHAEDAAEDAEDPEDELAALLGYAEQRNARSVFEGLDVGFPPPPPMGMEELSPFSFAPGLDPEDENEEGGI